MRKSAWAALLLACVLLLASCGKQSGSSLKQASSKVSAVSTEESEADSLPATVNLADEARQYASTPGRTALALIICRLDRSSALQGLTQKSAGDLFEMLRETAIQKSRTLESLDQQYDLHDILASEGIHVNIHANAADTVSGGAPAADWVSKFEASYAASASPSQQSSLG